MTNVQVRTRSEDPKELKTILQQTHDEALMQNDFATRHWLKVRDEHLSLRSHLVILPEKLSQEVMVPIGSKALMRGKMVHTNEILVCLGDGWFVKQTAKRSAEICDRRIQLCEKMLKDLERERDLLANRRQIPLEQDAFGAENRDEIFEPYDEEKEAKWRVEHRKKEKEYREKLNELNKEKTSIENEESLWKRLDELELQEELEEELDRLHAEPGGMGCEDDDDDDDEEEEEEEDEEQDEEESGEVEDEVQNHESSEPSDSRRSSGRRVSFADTKNGDSDSDSDCSAETLRIRFRHTPLGTEVQRSNEPNGHPIQNPADIHGFIKDLILKDGVPKSILKNKCTEPMSQQIQWTNIPDSTRGAEEDDEEEEEDNEDEHLLDSAEVKERPTVFGDVLEHKSIPDPAPQVEAPVTTAPSRFKAARLASRR